MAIFHLSFLKGTLNRFPHQIRSSCQPRCFYVSTMWCMSLIRKVPEKIKRPKQRNQSTESISKGERRKRFSAQGSNDRFQVCVYVVYFTPWSLQCSLTWQYLLSDQADNIVIANNVHSGIIVIVFVPVINSPFSSVWHDTFWKGTAWSALCINTSVLLQSGCTAASPSSLCQGTSGAHQ